MQKTAIINVVGLTPSLIGTNTPFLTKWSADGAITNIKPVLPAVTCSAQSTYLTGKHPNEHGIIGNGWYFRDECEVKFWRQSNKLVFGQKIWDRAKEIDPSFTCANMFWWYNMNATTNFSATPRPIYTADGLKYPDCYTRPLDLRDELQNQLGKFPLFNFWGPNTTIHSSQWIADATKIVSAKHSPTLTLVYLPHLDYNLQKLGPNNIEIAKDLNEIDNVCADLINFFESKGTRVILVSEYGITQVNNPISINRELRKGGYLKVRTELGRELLDPDASTAFAVADHQIAHIYINDKTKTEKIQNLVKGLNGVEDVFGEEDKIINHLDNPRSGELIAIAEKSSWFTYYYWLDPQKAPDFATTVDIHRKPGYDPVELFIDPNINWVKLKILITLLKKRVGLRYLMNFIPLDPTLVKGSHGRYPDNQENGPLLITKQKGLIPSNNIHATQVFDIILAHLFD